MNYVVDPALKQWATDKQSQYIDLVNEHGSVRAAERAIDAGHDLIGYAIRAVKKKARTQGYDPDASMTNPIGEPYFVKGTSTLYGPEGEVKQQWVKTQIDQEQKFQIIKEVIDELVLEVPKLPLIKKPAGNTPEDLLNLYTITDAHVGMLAWGKETGADWDLGIAERVLTQCFAAMIKQSPKAKYCLISQLGDFLHTDGILPLTPTSGHHLDADGRFSKIVAVAIRVLRSMVATALKDHEIVYVLMAEGNHDIVSSIWLRQMFKIIFEDNPRVKIIDSENPFYVHQHGKTMLAFHHGHKKRNLKDLPLLFAARYSEIWGATEYRYGHSGHWHHEKTDEPSGMKWKQHPTLSAPDAHAARGGYDSMREVEAITYSKRLGRVSGQTIKPEMFSEDS